MGAYNDLTLQDSRYIPQYAGLPLNTVRDVADTLAERHYQNLARMDQLDLLAHQQKTQVLPGDQWYVDQQIGNIRTALGELAKGGAENSSSKVSAMVNQYMGDQNILTSLSRAGEIQKEIEAENALRAAGKTPVRRVGAREQYQAGIIDRATGSIGEQFMSPYQSTAEAFVAPVPEMEEIWRTVNPDSWYQGLKADEKTKISKLIGNGQISPSMDMPLFFKVLRGEGISTDKISQMLDNAMSSYRNQPSYRQQTGVMGRSDDELRRDMLNQGLLRVFSKVDPQYIQNSVADDALRAWFKGTPGPGELEYLPAVPVENEFNYNVDKMHPDYEVSNVEHVINAMASQHGTTVGPLGVPTGKGYTGQDTKPTAQQKGDFFNDAMTAAEIAGQELPKDTSTWTKEDYAKAIGLVKGYQESIKTMNVSPYRTRYDDQELARQRSQIARDNITGRVFYDMNTGEKINTVDNDGNLVEEFTDIIGGDDSKLRAIGRIDAQNPYVRLAGPEFANAEVVQVWDAKNKHHRLALMTPAATELESTSGNIARNTGIVYSAVSKKPGSWAKFSPSVYGRGAKVTSFPEVEARQLMGAQLSNLLKDATPDVQAQATQSGIIEAKIDGKIMHFFGPEHLSKYLLTR